MHIFATQLIFLKCSKCRAHTPINSPSLPGLAHWTNIKVSELGSRVCGTPSRNNERTNDGANVLLTMR